MRIKLKDHVIHSEPEGHSPGRHLRKGEVHEVSDKLGASLVKRELAESTDEEPATEEEKPAADPDSEKADAKARRKELFKQYGTCTKAELLEVKADIDRALAENPDYAPAKSALPVITELLKKAK